MVVALLLQLEVRLKEMQPQVLKFNYRLCIILFFQSTFVYYITIRILFYLHYLLGIGVCFPTGYTYVTYTLRLHKLYYIIYDNSIYGNIIFIITVV